MGCATLHLILNSNIYLNTVSRPQRQKQLMLYFFLSLQNESSILSPLFLRSQVNEKCRDLRRPWSTSSLFGFKLSCSRWSYFESLSAACPVLPIPLSGNTESLIHCLSALLHPLTSPLRSVRSHKASPPCSFHLQMVAALL